MKREEKVEFELQLEDEYPGGLCGLKLDGATAHVTVTGRMVAMALLYRGITIANVWDSMPEDQEGEERQAAIEKFAWEMLVRKFEIETNEIIRRLSAIDGAAISFAIHNRKEVEYEEINEGADSSRD